MGLNRQNKTEEVRLKRGQAIRGDEAKMKSDDHKCKSAERGRGVTSDRLEDHSTK